MSRWGPLPPIPRVFAAALIAWTVVACSAPPAPPPPSPGIGLQASFVLANPAGLLALDGGGHSIGRIVDLPAQSAPATPVLYPSGKAIVFALTQQPDKKTGFGSDLYTVNLDGTGYKPVVQHESDNVFYASPRFDKAGNILYFHRRAAIIQGGSYVGNEDSLERLDLRTGERTRLLTNGADPTISPAGDRIVYTHLTQGYPDAIWTANIDGSNAHPYFKTRDTWWYLQTPRFAPTGCEIVFSAAGHAISGGPAPRPPVALAARGDAGALAARGDAGAVAVRGDAGALAVRGDAGALAVRGDAGALAVRGDGGARPPQLHLTVPSFLYLAPCDGTSVKEIGQTVDDVVPAWSPDGTQVAYVGTGAFFVLTLANGNVRTLAQGQDFFFGDLLWLK